MFFPMIAAASAALQPTPADLQDVRCVAAFAALSQLGGKGEDQTKLLAGMLYYIGKLDGRSPGLDLKSELSALLDQPDYLAGQLPADLKRCGEEAKARGQEIEDIGDAMKQGA